MNTPKHISVAGYKFERIDEWELRMSAPSGDAWTLRHSDDCYGFSEFIFDFAVAVADQQEGGE